MSKIKDVLVGAAPALVTALTGGNIFAGAAVSALTKAFDLKSTNPDQVLAEVQSLALTDPTVAVRLKELELQFKKDVMEANVKLGQQGIDLAKIDSDDRASARTREISLGNDWWNKATMLTLASCALLTLAFIIWIVTQYPLEQSSRDVMMMLVGGVIAIVNQVYNYYFGSSHGSSTKDRMITKFWDDTP